MRRSIPIVEILIARLVPSRTHSLCRRDQDKLLASLRSHGLIEPLVVRRDGAHYRILDGHIRYSALLELGVAQVPCLVVDGMGRA